MRVARKTRFASTTNRGRGRLGFVLFVRACLRGYGCLGRRGGSIRRGRFGRRDGVVGGRRGGFRRRRSLGEIFRIVLLALDLLLPGFNHRWRSEQATVN